MWWIAYGGLACLLIFRGVIPMLAVWRATDPNFVATRVSDLRSTAWTDEDRVMLDGQHFANSGIYEVQFGRQVLLIHLWLRADADATLAVGTSRLNGDDPTVSFSTFLSNGIGWLETRRTHDMPPLPGEIVQVLASASVNDLLLHHDQGLRRLEDYGITAGPVVALDAVQALRHHLMVARKQMRLQPLSWLIGTVLNNVRPTDRGTIADNLDLRPRLVGAGLLSQR